MVIETNKLFGSVKAKKEDVSYTERDIFKPKILSMHSGV